LDYSDHHIFSIDDLKEIRKRFNAISAQQKIILTTEKDAVRLIKFSDQLQNIPLYVLPIKHRFLFGDEAKFNTHILNFIETFHEKNNAFNTESIAGN
jgi:tetraacyldisaccharide 4'-kinase